MSNSDLERKIAISYLLAAIKSFSKDEDVHKEAERELPTLSRDEVERITISGGTKALRILGVSNFELLAQTMDLIDPSGDKENLIPLNFEDLFK